MFVLFNFPEQNGNKVCETTEEKDKSYSWAAVPVSTVYKISLMFQDSWERDEFGSFVATEMNI